MVVDSFDAMLVVPMAVSLASNSASSSRRSSTLVLVPTAYLIIEDVKRLRLPRRLLLLRGDHGPGRR